MVALAVVSWAQIRESSCAQRTSGIIRMWTDDSSDDAGSHFTTCQGNYFVPYGLRGTQVPRPCAGWGHSKSTVNVGEA